MLHTNVRPTSAGAVLGDHDLAVDFFFQLGHVGDNAHQPVTLRQARQGGVGLAEGLDRKSVV